MGTTGKDQEDLEQFEHDEDQAGHDDRVDEEEDENEEADDDETDDEDDDEEGRSSPGHQIYMHIIALPCMTREEQHTLLELMRQLHPDHYPILYTMARACLPLPAVLGLKIGDVNILTKVISVSRGWGELGEFPIPTPARPFHPHGDLGPLKINMEEDLVRVLTEQLAHLNATGRACGNEAWMFPGQQDRQPWKIQYVSRFSFLPTLKAGGFPKLCPRDLYYCFVKTRTNQESTK